MSTPRRILLINPTITGKRHARFPLAILSLASALEGHHGAILLDGNIERDFIDSAVRSVRGGHFDAVGVTVMGGPQLLSAIAVSKAIRAVAPSVRIIWGGAFPTLCADAALKACYVDYVVRSQGEDALKELLDVLGEPDAEAMGAVRGVSWRREGEIVHNQNRAFSARSLEQMLPYERLDNPRQYLTHTYLGARTAGYQAALGCRFRCTFCGVAGMYRGKTALPSTARLQQDLQYLRDQLGVDAIQFYDHNFFDREVDMQPLLEVMAKLQMPWWCFARSDALSNLSERSWELVKRSRLRMAYIGAESSSDWLLHDVRKGTRVDQTMDAIEKCRAYGVVPELSFMLAPPEDPEGETERTFDFIHRIKHKYPETEVMIYIYTPVPARRDETSPGAARALRVLRDAAGEPVAFPHTADEWAEPEWIRYWCHKDAPWLSARLRRRIVDFTTVLGCRFPTIMDVRAPRWGKATLRGLASWRYGLRRYEHPWELRLAKRVIRQWDPRAMSL